MDFGKELDKFATTTMTKIVTVKRNAAIKLFSAIVQGTPVGNPDLWASLWKDTDGRAMDPPEGYTGGRARANWRFSLNGFDESVSDDVDPNGAVTLSLLQSVALSADVNDSICMSNSLPYIYKLEYDGHSSQAPLGMVRTNVARFKKIVSDANKNKGFNFGIS